MAHKIKKGSSGLDNDNYKHYRQVSKDYKKAKAAQEVLEKSISQYAQEPQEEQEAQTRQQAQEILENKANYDIDIETGAILINGDKRPELDPSSPQFDKAQYNLYAPAANEQITASLEPLREELKKSAAAVMNSEAMQALLDTIKTAIEPIMPVMQAAVEAIANYENTIYKSVGDSIKYIVEHNEELQKQLQEWEQLRPYLEEELKKPEYGGRTIDDIMSFSSEDIAENNLIDDLLEKAVIAAKAAMLADRLPVVSSNSHIADLDYPLDKINANIWRLLKDADKTGQLTFAVEKRGSKKTADIIYSLNFEALEEQTGVTITKKLTAFDKRVYIAAGALFNKGYDVVTPAQIYIAMGNTGRPNANDIKKINDSLTKMQAAHIYLNNESEHQLYKKIDRFIYDASLLPMERISAVVNGQTVDSAIHFFREPPLISFARERKQITTVSRHLLESPLSKTDANLLIDDYLIERIAHIKNSKGKSSNKLLYETIYDKCQITTKMQRSRAKEKISKYLDHYKECKYIKDYKEEADGITIYY